MRIRTACILAFIAIIAGLSQPAAGFYSTKEGRFLQRDPLEYVDGMNLYEYCSSDPVKHLDEEGLSWATSPGAYDFAWSLQSRTKWEKVGNGSWIKVKEEACRRKTFPIGWGVSTNTATNVSVMSARSGWRYWAWDCELWPNPDSALVATANDTLIAAMLRKLGPTFNNHYQIYIKRAPTSQLPFWPGIPCKCTWVSQQLCQQYTKKWCATSWKKVGSPEEKTCGSVSNYGNIIRDGWRLGGFACKCSVPDGPPENCCK